MAKIVFYWKDPLLLEHAGKKKGSLAEIFCWKCGVKDFSPFNLSEGLEQKGIS